MAVNGLDEIFTHLYNEGRQANEQTAREAIDLLETAKNFIPSSEVVRREYAHVLTKQFREFIERRAGEKD
ncbi:MAG TPA: hypothetical protein VGJ94_12890 [Syntrophorhabdaceae bacterium]